MSEWISVEERLPPDCHEVMFFYVIYGNPHVGQENMIAKRDIVCGHRGERGWYICYLYTSMLLNENESVRVTHWRELPEYPK